MTTPMTPTPPNRADAIFAAALELPFGEREAHALAACGDDPALLDEVRTLISKVGQKGGSAQPGT